MKEKIREILENNGLNKSVELINDLINENKKFEPGWYWDCELNKKRKDFIIYLKEKEAHKSFGFTNSFHKGDVCYSKNNIKATHDEVLEMFTNEAKKRGIVDGCKLYHRDRDISVNVKSGDGYVLSDDMLSFYLNDCLIFKNGEWAEVVKEESLDELCDKYFADKKCNYLNEYIKENKEKFLIALNNL